MTAVQQATEMFARALADFDVVLRSNEHWRDDQRHRLERSQLAPLRAEANRFAAALRTLDASLESAERLLRQ